MRILQIGKYYYPHMGGIENHLYTLSTELKRLGHDVTVFVSNESNKFEEAIISGVKVFRYPQLFKMLNAPISFFKKIDKESFDIIHLHLPNPMASIFALLHVENNFVVTYHSDIIKSGIIAQALNFFYNNLILYPLLNKSKKILITSPNYFTDSKILQKYKSKIEVVPYGIDLDSFKLTSENKKILDELSKKYNDRKIILFVGRLVPYKGIEYLLKSLPEVIDEFNNLKLLIIGDGPLKNKLKQLVTELDINDHVEFIFSLHNLKIPPYYYLADMFVLPSVYKAEAIGIVQLEAMACGIPVISTKVKGSGISFVNENNKTGIVVAPRNSKDLSSAMKKLLGNPSLREKFGDNGKARVKKFFSKEIMTKKILGIYESTLRHLKVG